MSEPTFTEMAKPVADKLIMAGKMGCDIRLNPDGCKAHGELILKLAELLDAQHAKQWTDRGWRHELAKCWLFVAVMVAASLILN